MGSGAALLFVVWPQVKHLIQWLDGVGPVNSLSQPSSPLLSSAMVFGEPSLPMSLVTSDTDPANEMARGNGLSDKGVLGVEKVL